MASARAGTRSSARRWTSATTPAPATRGQDSARTRRRPTERAATDGDACTQTDTCQGGVCTGGNPVVCTALDQCHDAGTCDTGTGLCSNPPKTDGTGCTDGDACTQTDTCQGGVCTGGSPVVCTALDQCHDAGTCDTGTGLCSNPPKTDGTGCTDGDACTQTDTCQGGVCTGGNPVVCTALDQCHDAGTCDTGTGLCSNPPKTDGTGCTDGDACTQTDTCQGGVCTGGNPVVCTALDQCHDAGTCDTGTGLCSNPPRTDGSACTDGNACTTGDACSGGACQPGAPNTDPCDDGDLCTTGDLCGSGVCSGTPVTCQPGETCNPANGQCETAFAAPSCASAADCSDGDACTEDACDQVLGCTHTALDTDGDGLCDGLDNCAGAANVTQANADGDAAGDACDCAPADPAAYAVPGEAVELSLSGRGPTTMVWKAPKAPGGDLVLYDALKSMNPAEFRARGSDRHLHRDRPHGDGGGRTWRAPADRDGLVLPGPFAQRLRRHSRDPFLGPAESRGRLPLTRGARPAV